MNRFRILSMKDKYVSPIISPILIGSLQNIDFGTRKTHVFQHKARWACDIKNQTDDRLEGRLRWEVFIVLVTWLVSLLLEQRECVGYGKGRGTFGW